MQIENTQIPGCFVISLRKQNDSRGHFVKWFSRHAFDEAGLVNDWAEVYGSVSQRGVIRGLHFQSPPEGHAKLVYCLSGHALDVVLDLRQRSVSFGKHIKIELSGASPLAVYVPLGCAHGFLAQADQTLMFYQVSSGYAPEFENGIRWDSAGIDWPTRAPIISSRDHELPHLANFVSPFV